MEESLMDLLKDGAHWQFEIITHFVIEVAIIGLLWPIIKHLLKDHKDFHK